MIEDASEILTAWRLGSVHICSPPGGKETRQKKRPADV